MSEDDLRKAASARLELEHGMYSAQMSGNNPLDLNTRKDWTAWLAHGSNESVRLPDDLVQDTLDRGMMVEYDSNEPRRPRTIESADGRRFELTESGLVWLTAAVERELKRAEADAEAGQTELRDLTAERDRLAHLLNARSSSTVDVAGLLSAYQPVQGEAREKAYELATRIRALTKDARPEVGRILGEELLDAVWRDAKVQDAYPGWSLEKFRNGLLRLDDQALENFHPAVAEVVKLGLLGERNVVPSGGTATIDPETGAITMVDEGGGFGPEELQALLNGGLSVGEIQRRSPALSTGFAMMPDLWKQIAKAHLSKELAEGRELTGHDVADEIRMLGHLDDRITEDKIMLDMLENEYVTIASFDADDLDATQWRLTAAGKRVGEQIIANDYDLPPIPEGHVRCLVIRTDEDSKPAYEFVIKPWASTADEQPLLDWVQEQVGGFIEPVFLFQRPLRHFVARVGDPSKPYAVAFVNEEGLPLGLPPNLHATSLLTACGALPQDVGKYIAGTTVVFALAGEKPGEFFDFDRELPQGVHEYVSKGTKLQVVGLKEVHTDELRRLSQTGHEEGFRWTLDPRLAHLLDPQGVHLLNLMAVLDHDDDGLPVDSFIRCRLLAKVRGSMTAMEQEYFDVRLRDFAALRTVQGAERDVDPATAMPFAFTGRQLAPDERTP